MVAPSRAPALHAEDARHIAAMAARGSARHLASSEETERRGAFKKWRAAARQIYDVFSERLLRKPIRDPTPRL